jgi:1-acyl-sn-glycerol-3-phosphate acyltransferase
MLRCGESTSTVSGRTPADLAMPTRCVRPAMVIEPEATRSYTPHWKSGFYHIAHGAAVPLALGFIDYSRREIGFLGTLELTGDRDADLARIARMYEGRVGRYPAQQGPIRLREQADGRG